MTNALMILAIILSSLAIIVSIYMIFSFRRMSIVTKKIDYLVEDLTYKSEVLTPVIDAIVKLSAYADVFGTILDQKYDLLIKNINKNKETIHRITDEPTKK